MKTILSKLLKLILVVFVAISSLHVPSARAEDFEDLLAGGIELTDGTSYAVEKADGVEYFRFTAESTGNYVIYSDSAIDPRIEVYASDFQYLDSDYDSGKDNNFCYFFDLQQGETLYFVTSTNNGSESYSVFLRKNPIRSLTMNTITRYEGLGDQRSYEDENGQLQTYCYYSMWFDDSLTLQTDDFTSSGTWESITADLYMYYDMAPDLNLSSDQSETNQWQAGRHTAYLEVGNKLSFELYVDIITNPVVSIETQEISIPVENYYMETEYNEQNELLEYRKYYVENNKEVTVHFDDGESYSGTTYQVSEYMMEKYGCSPEYYTVSDQSYDNQWEVGVHSASLFFNNVEGVYTVRIIDNPIVSLTADDITVYYLNDGSYMYDQGNRFFNYNLNEANLTATFINGETVTGNTNAISNHLQEEYDYGCSVNIIDGQSFENQWGIGQHQVEVFFGNRSTQFTVTVAPSPIESLTVEPVKLLSDQHYIENDSIYTDEGYVNVQYYKYNIWPAKVSVVTADGDSYTGITEDVTQWLSEKYDHNVYGFADSDQGYGNEWSTGTHQATLILFGKSAEYEVSIIDTPIVSITADPVNVSDRDLYTEWWYDDDGVAHEYQAYQNYNAQKVYVTFNDGVTIQGGTYEVEQTIYEEYGLNLHFEISSDQSPDNIWGAGQHQATIRLGSVIGYYTVNVIFSPIVDMTADDLDIYEYSNGWFSNGENGEFYMYNTDTLVSLTLSDGRVIRGTYSELTDVLVNDYGYEPQFVSSSDQYVNPWQVGQHQANISCGNLTAGYNINILPSPIVSLEIKDLIIAEGAYVEEEDGYYDDQGEYHSVTYNYYRYDDVRLKVVLDDGDSYEGTYWSVFNDLENKYQISLSGSLRSDQSYENQWQAGTHQARLNLFGWHQFNVIIRENPVNSIEVASPVIVYRNNYWNSSSYDEDGNLITYYEYNIEPVSITVHFKDGSQFTGRPSDARNYIRECYGTEVNYGYNSDLSREQIAEVGNYNATFVMAGLSVPYVVSVENSPIVSVTASEKTWYLGSGELYEDGENFWVYYNSYPESITVTLKNGQQFTGNPNEVSDQVYDACGFRSYLEVMNSQKPDNCWTEAGTYSVRALMYGIEFEYQVTLLPSPIVSITVPEITVFETEDHYYELQPRYMTVELENGTVISDRADFVNWQINNIYGISFNQPHVMASSYDTLPWENGTHTVSAYFGGIFFDYNITVVENQILSVTIAPVTKLYDRYIWLERLSDEYGEYEIRHYDVNPTNITIVTTSATYTGSLYSVVSSIKDELGVDIDYEAYEPGQSRDDHFMPDHQYVCTLMFNGKQYDYQLNLISNPIASVVFDDIYYYEGQTITQYDEYGRPYQAYEINRGSVTVNMRDGRSLYGNIYEILDQLIEEFGDPNILYYEDEQSVDNVWGVGDHQVTIEIMGVAGTCTIHIQASPFASISADDIYVLEGQTRLSESWYYDENGVEHHVSYYEYPIAPKIITLTMSDGTVLKGTDSHIYMLLEQQYNITDVWFSYTSEQSDTVTWGLGEHTATISIIGLSAEYKVTVLSSPIVSVSVEDVHVFVNDNYQRSYYFEDEKEVWIEDSFDAYNIYPESVTVVLANGATFTGGAYEATEFVSSQYDGVEVMYECYDDQRPDNIWGLGAHDVYMIFGGQRYPYKAYVEEEIIDTIKAADKNMMLGDTTVGHVYELDEYGAYTVVEVEKYDETPDLIEMTTLDGHVFTGNWQQVNEAFRQQYGFGLSLYAYSNQGSKNVWGVGDHAANVIINNSMVIPNYQVHISEGDPDCQHQFGQPVYTWDEKNKVVGTAVCEKCGFVVKDTAYMYVDIITEPTCTDEGLGNFTATFINPMFATQVRQKALPILAHEYGQASYTWSADNSSVTASRTCQNCGHEESETVSTTSQTVAPTCEEDGTVTFVAEFENEAFEAQTKTVTGQPATGHAWSEVTYTWADDNSSVTATRTCGNDGSHVETETVFTEANTVAPSCEEAGTTTYTAFFSNPAFETQSRTVTDQQPLGHAWGEWTVTTQPTCTEKGIETRVCANDPSHIEMREVEPLGHDWNEPTYTWSDDNSEVTATRTCKRDGAHAETETVVTTVEPVVAPDCTHGGVVNYVATFENEAFVQQRKDSEVVDALGHDPADAVIENNTTATCSEPGNYDVVVYCSRCHEELSRTHVEGEVLGHDYQFSRFEWNGFEAKAVYVCSHDASHVEEHEAEVTNEITVQPGCEETGIRTYTATYDGHTDTKEETLPATDHAWGEWTVTKEPTCTEKGIETRVCANDPTHVETREKNSLGHLYIFDRFEWDGFTAKAVYVCARDKNHVEKMNATITNEITKQPTCEETGIRTYTATYDKHTGFREETIPAKGHTPAEAVRENEVAATCQKAGGYDTVVYCSDCHKELSREHTTVPASGHDYQFSRFEWNGYKAKAVYVCSHDASHVEEHDATVTSKVTKEAGCETTGTRTYTATYDGHTATKNETIPAKGHTAGTAVRENEVAATCQKAGGYDTVVYCKVCGKELSRVHTNLPALGHKYGPWKADETKGDHYRTCTNDPSHVERGAHSYVDTVNGSIITHTCSVCGHSYTEDVFVKPSVTRIYGADRYKTSYAIADTMKKTMGVDKFENVVLASGLKFPDALAGSYLAIAKKAPILLAAETTGRLNTLVKYLHNNLRADGIIYILGGTSAVSKDVEDRLVSEGFKIVRAAGDDRYGTGVEIMKAAGKQITEIIVCHSEEFPDALSASSTGKPILLVKGAVLRKVQKQYLRTLKNVKFTIVGGTDMVSGEVEEALKEFGSVERLLGSDKFIRSSAVAEKYYSDPDTVYMVYGDNYPDGLCDGPLAYLTKAPIILGSSKDTEVGKKYVLTHKLKNGYVIGGTDVFSDQAAREIFRLDETDVITEIIRK